MTIDTTGGNDAMSSRYPTEDELKRITDWPFDDLDGLMDFIKPIVDYYGAVRKIDGRYHVITGGWSGNEDVVGALLNNIWIRSSCYQSWERGGKFVFAKDIENTEVDDMLERISALEAEIRDAHTILDAQGTSSDVGNDDFTLVTRIAVLVGMLAPKYERVFSSGNTSNERISALEAERTMPPPNDGCTFATATGELTRCRELLTACGISEHSTISGGIDELNDLRQWTEEERDRAQKHSDVLETERNNLSLGLDKANGRILALEQIESNLTSQRNAARRAAAAFYSYIRARIAERKHYENCGICIDLRMTESFGTCESLYLLEKESERALAEAMEIAKDFKP